MKQNSFQNTSLKKTVMRNVDEVVKMFTNLRLLGGYDLLLLLLLLSRFSHVRLCAIPQTAAHQALPSLVHSICIIEYFSPLGLEKLLPSKSLCSTCIYHSQFIQKSNIYIHLYFHQSAFFPLQTLLKGFALSWCSVNICGIKHVIEDNLQIS